MSRRTTKAPAPAPDQAGPDTPAELPLDQAAPDQAAAEAPAAEALDTPPAPASPSVEKRLEALERLLQEKTATIAVCHENNERLRESRERGRDLERQRGKSADVAKRARKAFENWFAAHLALEDELATGQLRLPFAEAAEEEEGGEEAPAADGAADGNGQATGEELAAAADDTAWKAVKVAALDLEGKLTDTLRLAGILTIGDLAAWTAPDEIGRTRQLTDLQGIGRARADRIEEALERFWAGRRTEAALEASLAEASGSAGAAEENGQ